MNAGRVAGKVALITGAARGQGAAEARLFAAEGAVVVLADVLDDDGETTAAQIRASGGRAEYHHLDVTDESAWSALVADVGERLGRLDMLVNNAGVGDRRGIIDMGLRGWDRVLDINVWGPLVGMREVAPVMARGDGGAIVNISSVAGLTGYDAAAYTSSKWALRGITKTAALEFANDGIRVNSVHPGTIITPMISDVPDELVRSYVRVTPQRRAAEPEEIATAVLYLCSDEASFITGTELVVDGGFVAGGANLSLDLRLREIKEVSNA